MAFGRDEEMQARRIAEMRQMAQASRQRQGEKSAKGKGIGQLVGTGAGMALNLIPGYGQAASAIATPVLAKVGGMAGEQLAGGKPMEKPAEVALDTTEGLIGGLSGGLSKSELQKGKTNLQLLAEALRD